MVLYFIFFFYLFWVLGWKTEFCPKCVWQIIFSKISVQGRVVLPNIHGFFDAVEELRADIYRVLRHPHHLKPYLSRDEMMAIKQLRSHKDQMILNTDKGVALVVMDRQDYIREARELLEDTNTYRPSQSDPANKLKTKLINTLQKKGWYWNGG